MRRIGLALAAGVVASAFAAAFSPQSAHAWSPRGHALIGEIADQLLADTNAGRKVDEILGSYGLEDAAKWPDCVRSVHKEPSGKFKFKKDQFTDVCTKFFGSKEKKRMEDYASRNWDPEPRPGHGLHEQYHFADVPIQDHKYDAAAIGAFDHDVVQAINAAIAKLKGQTVPPPFSIKDDKEAILLLAHFVGDLHQPLHVGAIYLDTDGNVVDPTALMAETPSKSGAAISTVNGMASYPPLGAMSANWWQPPGRSRSTTTSPSNSGPLHGLQRASRMRKGHSTT
jgi:hypothetical protein